MFLAFFVKFGYNEGKISEVGEDDSQHLVLCLAWAVFSHGCTGLFAGAGRHNEIFAPGADGAVFPASCGDFEEGNAAGCQADFCSQCNISVPDRSDDYCQCHMCPGKYRAGKFSTCFTCDCVRTDGMRRYLGAEFVSVGVPDVCMQRTIWENVKKVFQILKKVGDFFVHMWYNEPNL